MITRVVSLGLLLALSLVLAAVSPGWAQQKVTPVTTLISTSSTGDSAELGVEFYSSVSFTITMSSTGTVQFKVSGNGTTYSDLSCFASDDTSGTPVTSATASGTYQCNVAAMQKVKVTVAANGGTIVVESQASSAVAKLKGGGGGGGGGAPTTATYIMQTANGGTSAEQALGALATGCLGSTTTTGVVASRTLTGTANQITVANGDCSGTPTFSIPTNPTLPGTTTGTFSGNLTGNVTGNADTATTASAGDSATSFFSSGTLEDARLPSSMADKVFTGSILLPNGTSVPGTCSIGMIYFDNDATAGVNLYGCTASNTWTLLGDGGGAGSVATDTIWDAAGDLAVGSGANTAARLAMGTANQVLKVNAGGTAVEWATDATGGSPTFDGIGSGSNTTATMTVGAGGSVVPTSTGIIAATAMRPTILTVNAGNSPYTGLNTDAILLCDTTAATRAITLPAATVKILYKVKNLGANTCTITRAGTDTIDGATTAVLRNQYEAIDLVSDGTSAWSVF